MRQNVISNEESDGLFHQLETFVDGKMEVVRPSFASLSSLAKVLREANTIYQECHSILGGLPSLPDVSNSSVVDREPDKALDPPAATYGKRVTRG